MDALMLDDYPMPWTKVDGDSILPFCELPDRFLCGTGVAHD